jgi:hypothetical protein
MRFVYTVVYLLPTLVVVALACFVVRAVSVRVVWREGHDRLGHDSRA